jgi:hypothetical protein
LEERLKPGDINPFIYSENTLRQGVQMALRRLGKKPIGLPATGLNYYVLEKSDDGETYLGVGPDYQAQQYDSPRANRVASIHPGMKVIELLDALGPPDHIGFDDWLFDIDAAKPYTLSIHWNESARVKRIDHNRPRWKNNH